MTESRSQIIADAIEQRILTHQLHDGQRLDEVRMAEQFKVSRTPVREALQQLAAAGLVEAIPRRGVFVRQPGAVELLEMFEMMAGLEAMCGRLAANRISNDALEELREANANCETAVRENDADAYYAENERFHHTIYREAGNRFLERETLQLYRRLKPFRRMQLRARGRLVQSLSEHQQIVDDLAAGDGEAAAKSLLAHVSVQGEKFNHLIATMRKEVA